MKTRRILSVLITVVMLIGMLPTAVFAEGATYNLWVGGVQVTSANKDNIVVPDATGSAKYDPTNNTLTLDGFTYNGAAGDFDYGNRKAVIGSQLSDLTILLKGENTITVTGGFGIFSTQNLAICDYAEDSAVGSLNANAPTNAVATVQTLTITGVNLTVTSTEEIPICSASLTITSANVSATGAWGALCAEDDITITNSKIEAYSTGEDPAFDPAPDISGDYTVYAGVNKAAAEEDGPVESPDDATYENKYVKIEPAHTHCICGETHKAVGDHTAEQAATWTAWDGTSAIPYDSTTKTAYVYLSADAKRDSKLSVADDYTLNLCLNGHSLSPADGFSSDIFDLNGTLTLTDCVGGGKITGSKLYSVYLRGGTFNMYGGAITKSNNSAVEVDHGGTFNMYGGEIKNNKAYRGAGIYHHDGTIRISGGTITGNVAQDEGGAIYSQQSGIEICGNPVIAENFVNSGADGEANQINNIYAYSIEIVGPMTDGASIGMTNVAEEFGGFAIDTYGSSADYSKYFFSDKGYPVYKEGDFYCFGYRITKQPSDTDYSVEVNSTNGASYQWCEVIKGAPVSVDDTYLEDNDGYVIGDYGENGWSALVNSDVSMYFGIEMNANDELTAKFASAPQGEVILVNANTNSFVPVISGGENTYTFITVDEGPYLLAVFAEDAPTVKATLTKNTLKEVDGKTAATLDTGNLPTGNYACQITWDYLNTPDDTSDDYILQSVVVEYIVPQYTITFASNGGSAVESKTCEYNQTITAPDEPTKEGFEFIAWYADDALTTKWNFETPVTENKTLYAKWVQGTVSDLEDHVNEVEVEGLNNIAKAEETDIKLVVQTEPIAEGDTEQTAIKGIADAPNNFNFYDITLEKSTGGYVTDATSVIEIKLPYDFSRKTNLKVYRYHNGIPEELAQLEARATAPYADGKCFIDTANNCIYIYSLKFSTYAVAYDAVRSSFGGGVTRYTIKFDTDGGSKIASKTVTKNSKIAEPTVPEKEGYTFIGWFIDEEFTTAYDFESKITKNITLYAKWEKVDEQESEDSDIHNCPSKAFDDLDVNAWYHEDADYVIENGIFKGIGETTFAPNDKLTRAMLVTVLYRMENEPATNRSIPFSDVDMGAYYANAISWAKQNGIVNGVTENEFAPNDNITREQIAAIMMRYAVYKGMETITLEENLHFADADEISEYAVSSMNWAVGTGLINGKSESTLAPKDNATRIEVAAILHRFIEENK